jgi:hypothetical protein
MLTVIKLIVILTNVVIALIGNDSMSNINII